MRILFCLGMLLAALSGGAAGIVIEGTVTLPAARAAAAAKAHYQGKISGLLPPDPPAAVVYLEGQFPARNASTNRAVISQEGFQFRPRLLAIQRGAQVEVPNLDGDYHSVFSYSKTKEFDLGRFRKGETPPPILFEKAGVVSVGCEIHDHMRAAVLVLDTPWFVKTDNTGRFRLEIDDSVPPGKYTLKAWIDERRVREAVVELKIGAPIRVDFPDK